MARIILHTESSPLKIEASDKDRWLCRCGLSKNMPWCDGTHKSLDEEEGKTYKYNNDGSREEL